MTSYLSNQIDQLRILLNAYIDDDEGLRVVTANINQLINELGDGWAVADAAREEYLTVQDELTALQDDVITGNMDNPLVELLADQLWMQFVVEHEERMSHGEID